MNPQYIYYSDFLVNDFIREQELNRRIRIDDRQELFKESNMVLKCEKVGGCKPNEYQDSRYGEGMRVHNPCGKEKTVWRCSVCVNERNHGKSEETKKKGK